jgi:hypothetical protein
MNLKYFLLRGIFAAAAGSYLPAGRFSRSPFWPARRSAAAVAGGDGIEVSGKAWRELFSAAIFACFAGSPYSCPGEVPASRIFRTGRLDVGERLGF